MSRRPVRKTLALIGVVGLLAGPLVSGQEIDFSGEWRPLYHEDGPERIPGPDLADYGGIPINDAARLRADSYDPARIEAVSEYTCRQHGADYSMRGLANLRIERVIDPVTQEAVAFRTRMGFHNMERTIWLDGREHPSAEAPHTWQGFSTGAWNGNMLEIRTTHLKPNYLRRNGLPASGERTLTEHWVRHGNYLTVVTVIEDPVFLTERLVRSQSWVLDPDQRMGSNPCEYSPAVPIAETRVPHYLPGQNPFISSFSETYGIPLEGARGGAKTQYPEFRREMSRPAAVPAQCTLYCRCMNEGTNCRERP